MDEERLKQIAEMPMRRDLSEYNDQEANYRIGREMATAIRELMEDRHQMLLQNSELRIHLRAMCDEIGDPARFKEARELALGLLSKSEKQTGTAPRCAACGAVVYVRVKELDDANRLLSEERERCARIAEGWMEAAPGHRETAWQIAQEIRQETKKRFCEVEVNSPGGVCCRPLPCPMHG